MRAAIFVLFVATACGPTRERSLDEEVGVTDGGNVADAGLDGGKLADAGLDGGDVRDAGLDGGLPAPGANEVVFETTCAATSWCATPSADFGRVLRGAIRTCRINDDVIEVELYRVSEVAERLLLKFRRPSAGENAPLEEFDWTLQDGSSWFSLVGPSESNPTLQATTSAVALGSCGAEIEGRFEVSHACEMHTAFSNDPWWADLRGRFRCTPPAPIACP